MNELLKLKDIKPNVPVYISGSSNYNLYLIIIICLIVFLLVFILIKKHINLKKEKLALFSLINNPKKFAYEFTKKAKKYKNKKNEKLLNEIIIRLGEYKYKPEVSEIDNETIKLVKKYLEIK